MPKRTHSKHRREHAQIWDEEAVLNGSTADIVEAKEQESHPGILPAVAQRLPSGSTIARDLYGPNDRPSSRIHDALRARSTSCMNERFPLIDTGRPPSRPASRKSPPAESEQGQGKGGSRTTSALTSSTLSVPLIQPGSKGRPPYLRTAKSTNSFPRSKSTLAQYTINAPAASNLPTSTNIDENRKASQSTENTSSANLLSTLHALGHSLESAKVNPTSTTRRTTDTTFVKQESGASTKTLPTLHRPKSAFDIRSSTARNASRRSRIAQIPMPAPRNFLDADMTMKDITKGPYHERETPREERFPRFTALSGTALGRDDEAMAPPSFGVGTGAAITSKGLTRPASFYKENAPFQSPSPGCPAPYAEHSNSSPVRNFDDFDAMRMPSTPPRSPLALFPPTQGDMSEIAVKTLFRSSDDFARILHVPSSSRTSENFARKLRELEDLPSTPTGGYVTAEDRGSITSTPARFFAETPTMTSRAGRRAESQTPTSAGHLLAERFLNERRRGGNKGSMDADIDQESSPSRTMSSTLGSPVFL